MNKKDINHIKHTADGYKISDIHPLEEILEEIDKEIREEFNEEMYKSHSIPEINDHISLFLEKKISQLLEKRKKS